MYARKRPFHVSDKGGEKLGIAAALKGAFGTDSEIYMRQDTAKAFRNARNRISEMAEAATQLSRTSDGRTEEEKDSIEQAFQEIIKDL